MKPVSICLLAVLLSSIQPASSQGEPKSFAVKDNTDLTKIFPSEYQYLIGSFVYSDIYLLDGKVYKAKLDYNFLRDEIHHQDSLGQLIVLTDLKRIHFVKIGSHVIVNIPGYGYFENIYPNNYSLLLKRKAIIQEDQPNEELPFGVNPAYKESVKVKHFDFGQVGVENYSEAKRSEFRGSLNYIEEYWIQNNRHIKKVKSDHSFCRAFPRSQHSAIQGYITRNNTDFNDQKSLISLLGFCNTLK